MNNSITNCNFTVESVKLDADITSAVLALAEAAQRNAEAIFAISRVLDNCTDNSGCAIAINSNKRNKPLVNVEDNPEEE